MGRSNGGLGLGPLVEVRKRVALVQVFSYKMRPLAFMQDTCNLGKKP